MFAPLKVVVAVTVDFLGLLADIPVTVAAKVGKIVAVLIP
jgi:hypothetical protein